VKRKLWIFGVAGVFLAVCTFLLFKRGPENTSYHGKSLKDWAALAYANDQEAIAVIREIGPAALPGLLRLLQVQDSALRRNVRSLMPILSKEWRQVVWKKLGPANASATRSSAARCLGIIGPGAGAAVPGLVRALEDAHSQVRSESATALSKIGKAALPAFLAALPEADVPLRRSLLYGLAEIGPDAEPALPLIVKELQHPDETIRSAADYALTAIRLPLVRELVKQTRSPDPATRQQAIYHLQTLGGYGVTNIFVRALRDPAAEVRLAAQEALQSIQSPINRSNNSPFSD